MTQLINPPQLTNEQREALLIAQEECAEVSQVVSKIFRFGLTELHDNKTNRERLEEEIGDLMCMIELLVDLDVVDPEFIERAKHAKRYKLEKWSTHLFKKELVHD